MSQFAKYVEEALELTSAKKAVISSPDSKTNLYVLGSTKASVVVANVEEATRFVEYPADVDVPIEIVSAGEYPVESAKRLETSVSQKALPPECEYRVNTVFVAMLAGVIPPPTRNPSYDFAIVVVAVTVNEPLVSIMTALST